MKAIFQSFDARRPGWRLCLDRPRAVHVAHSLGDVRPILAAAEKAADGGRWAAVALAYEAAPAFDPAMRVRASGLPVAWVGIFDGPSPPPAPEPPGPFRTSPWTPLVAPVLYRSAVEQAQRHIAAGDTYQVNYTFPLACRFEGDAWSWFRSLGAAQGAAYCAYVDLGGYRLLSLSPELFFDRHGNRLVTRPMKGTLPRGRWPEEDEAMGARLVASEKMRAENVMIVDLLRNDLGRIAAFGTVRVPQLFACERYETLWQMTSTVEAVCRPGTRLTGVLEALFPCGSVTGAPKIRTMDIIAALEPLPRGFYTGAIGFVRPGGDCTFNVAIRTVLLDTTTGAATCGVGGGITADSTAEGEHDEALLKARFLSRPRQEFRLLETILLADGEYVLLQRHLERLRRSARYFGFELDPCEIARALEARCAPLGRGRWRVRLLVDHQGAVTVQTRAMAAGPGRPLRVRFAPDPIDSSDPFLFHKTTHREPFERARQARPDCEDVILWNERGEVTESTIANIVVADADGWWTPPRSAGLLAGTYREELLERGQIRERPIRRPELERAGTFQLVNSVTGWMPAALIS